MRRMTTHCGIGDRRNESDGAGSGRAQHTIRGERDLAQTHADHIEEISRQQLWRGRQKRQSSTSNSGCSWSVSAPSVTGFGRAVTWCLGFLAIDWETGHTPSTTDDSEAAASRQFQEDLDCVMHGGGLS